MESTKKTLATHRWPLIYSILAILIALAYISARNYVLSFAGYYVAIHSQVTLNLILIYGIWGYESGRRTKERSFIFRWLVFLGGCAILTLLFRSLGIRTIFG